MSATKCLNSREVCETLGISLSTLHRLRKSSSFPEPILIAKNVKRFRQQDVQDWLDQQRDATSNAAAVKEN